VLGKHIRVEHWANALHQPQNAARTIPGQDVASDSVPFFLTDQYELSMEYSGYAKPTPSTIRTKLEKLNSGQLNNGPRPPGLGRGERLVGQTCS
jgi:hypothetical protein